MLPEVDVSLLPWPDEDERRRTLRVSGRPRLLLIADGHPPPPLVDCLEDWIRVPAPEEEMRARVEALAVRMRAHHHAIPVLDPDGVLRYGERWTALPPLESRLAEALVARFGAVASRETLIRAGWPSEAPGRNALDVHVLRLRRRLAPLALAIRTVRSRGYLLEAGPPEAQPLAP